jgi:hypothetical protein
MNDIPADEKWVWTPALEQREGMRTIGEVLRLPKTARQVKELTKRIERLEAPKDHQG